MSQPSSPARIRVAAWHHPVFKEHDTGAGHPERPERLDAILGGLREAGVTDRLRWIEPEPAAEEDLARVHDPEHVKRILSLRGQSGLIDADTVVSPSSVEAALRAAGAPCQAAEAVLRGEADYGFCFVRPPGHHAERARSMGFCLFNNIAVAAARAIAKNGIKRVLIFDPDVHHGNGTQAIFYERDDVFFISIHQWPFYPGTGAADEKGRGAGEGKTVNVPLPAGSGDEDYLKATRETLLPAIDEFRPELVLFSAGFDAHEDDPLGGMRVSGSGFCEMYRLAIERMREHGIPGVFCLEGGYSLDALRSVVPRVVSTVLD